MKTLEQLGISPTPWTKAGDIVDDNEGRVIFNAYEDDDYANARLIAAAPKLYKSLREAIIEICHKCKHCSGYPSYNCANTKTGCFVEKWRDVLSEAAGESEVSK